MIQRYGRVRAPSRAIRNGIREIERNEEIRASQGALGAEWLKYGAPDYANDVCAMCGTRLEIGTVYIHCARCLSTRGVEETALRRACARVFEDQWPFHGRLDGRAFAMALIAFWRDAVDPMESRAIPYRNNTLESAFTYVQRYLADAPAVCVWTAPLELAGDPAMVVRAQGGTLAIGVGTQRRIATFADGHRRSPLASFDHFLELAGEREGVLVIEKLTRRARRDAPICEGVVESRGGRRVTQLRCLQPERGGVTPLALD